MSWSCQPADRTDHAGVAQRRRHVGQRQPVRRQAVRVDQHVDLARGAALHGDLLHALDRRQQRHDLELRQVAQRGLRLGVGGQRVGDDREGGGVHALHRPASCRRAARAGCARSPTAPAAWRPPCCRPSRNRAGSRADPRLVVERTSRTPGTPRTASSTGRVTSSIIWSAGRSPASSEMRTRGKDTGGNSPTGRKIAAYAPASASANITTRIERRCCSTRSAKVMRGSGPGRAGHGGRRPHGR